MSFQEAVALRFSAYAASSTLASSHVCAPDLPRKICHFVSFVLPFFTVAGEPNPAGETYYISVVADSDWPSDVEVSVLVSTMPCFDPSS